MAAAFSLAPGPRFTLKTDCPAVVGAFRKLADFETLQCNTSAERTRTYSAGSYRAPENSGRSIFCGGSASKIFVLTPFYSGRLHEHVEMLGMQEIQDPVEVRRRTCRG